MEWRKKWEVDTTLRTAPAPEGLVDYLPSGIPGLSKDGTPGIHLIFSLQITNFNVTLIFP